MYHSFLIHSSADGHLGCFHVLAILNSAVMNFGVHMSLGYICLGVEFLGQAYVQLYTILPNIFAKCWYPLCSLRRL